LRYIDSLLNARELKKSLILAGKIKNEKNERDEKENYFYCFGDRTWRGTFFTENILKKVKAQHFSGWQVCYRLLTITDNQFSSTFISIVSA